MEAPTPTPSPSVPRSVTRLPLVLLLAALTVVFSTGCASMQCSTCPDARNQAAHESQAWLLTRSTTRAAHRAFCARLCPAWPLHSDAGPSCWSAKLRSCHVGKPNSTYVLSQHLHLPLHTILNPMSTTRIGHVTSTTFALNTLNAPNRNVRPINAMNNPFLFGRLRCFHG